MSSRPPGAAHKAPGCTLQRPSAGRRGVSTARECEPRCWMELLLGTAGCALTLLSAGLLRSVRNRWVVGGGQSVAAGRCDVALGDVCWRVRGGGCRQRHDKGVVPDPAPGVAGRPNGKVGERQSHGAGGCRVEDNESMPSVVAGGGGDIPGVGADAGLRQRRAEPTDRPAVDPNVDPGRMTWNRQPGDRRLVSEHPGARCHVQESGARCVNAPPQDYTLSRPIPLRV